MSIERMRERMAADRASFIEPCLPSQADKPPVRRQLDSRDQARRLPAHGPARPCGDPTDHPRGPRLDAALSAVNHLKVRSCLIDGEVVCGDERGLATFQLLRHRRNEPQAFLYCFDLLELDGADLRREPIEVRKATLASILRKSRHGVRLNEHLEHDCGLTVFQHACKMGLEGIV
jgi:bifunctional non-homologous end joining protein LigD